MQASVVLLHMRDGKWHSICNTNLAMHLIQHVLNTVG